MMSKKSKKKRFQFALWWQSKKFRFVAASLVLVFIAGIGTIQTASQVNLISNHQILSESSNTLWKSVFANPCSSS